ncbi:MAG: hypothetical protein KIH62_001375 [Candidatus Kerfeldbacteria bacterium]|nr:hypothetical protein [Candidatus Kerfeldbacteria bacterium]
MTPERTRAVQEAEREILKRLDALFILAEHKNTDFTDIKNGYQEVVDAISKKYSILGSELAEKQLSDFELNVQSTELQKQFTADIAKVAVTIDAIRES